MARRQEQIAREQQRLAERAAAETRRQEQIAQEQARLAREAAEEARQEKANAEQQRRIAIGRRLVNQAKATIDKDPKTALMLGAAAQKVQPDAEMRRELTGLATSTRHAGTLDGMKEVSFASNGVLATLSDDGVVSLWDVADRAKPARLTTVDIDGGETASNLKISRDGGTLAVSHGYGKVTLWDLADPSDPLPFATLPSGDRAPAVEFSPDGRTLAMGDLGDDNRIASLWDLTDRTAPKELAPLISTESYAAGTLAFSPDGRTLVTPSRIWNVSDPAHPASLGEFDGTRSMVFSPTDPLLAIVGLRAVVLWDLADPDNPIERPPLEGHADSIASVAFSSDGRILATGDHRGSAILWEMDSGFPVRIDSVTGYGPVESMALSPNGRTLATTGRSAIARLWNVEPHGAPQRLPELTDHIDRTLAVAFSADGRSMAAAGDDGTAVFWDTTNPARPARRATPRIHDGDVEVVAFGPDLRTVAAAGHDGRVTLSDVTDPSRPVIRATFRDEVSFVGAMTFSPDGRTLAVPGHFDKVMLWDLAGPDGPTRRATLAGAHTPVAFSPDGLTLAAVRGKTVPLWDLTNLSAPVERGALVGHQDTVGPVAFSPDGRTVATGSSDDTAILWDVTDPAHPDRLATMLGHDDRVASLAFTSDRGTLATISNNSKDEAMLWDIADRTSPVRVAVFKHTPRTEAVINRFTVFSPDGRTLAFGTDNDWRDATVALWDYTKLNQLRADPVKQACAITGRGLNAGEWARYVPELEYQRTCPG